MLSHFHAGGNMVLFPGLSRLPLPHLLPVLSASHTRLCLSRSLSLWISLTLPPAAKNDGNWPFWTWTAANMKAKVASAWSAGLYNLFNSFPTNNQDISFLSHNLNKNAWKDECGTQVIHTGHTNTHTCEKHLYWFRSVLADWNWELKQRYVSPYTD